MNDEILNLQNQPIQTIFFDLYQKLINYALEDNFEELLGESLVVFYNLGEGEEYVFDPSEEFLFLTWFILDDSDLDRAPLIDTFLEKYRDNLSIQEVHICQALRETYLSLLQVEDFVENESIYLKDVFSGEEFHVHETSASKNLVKGSLLYSRILKLAGQHFLVGAGIFLDPVLKDPLTKFITDQYRLECEEGDPMNFKEFLKHNGELINWWIRAFEKENLSKRNIPVKPLQD